MKGKHEAFFWFLPGVAVDSSYLCIYYSILHYIYDMIELVDVVISVVFFLYIISYEVCIKRKYVFKKCSVISK